MAKDENIPPLPQGKLITMSLAGWLYAAYQHPIAAAAIATIAISTAITWGVFRGIGYEFSIIVSPHEIFASLAPSVAVGMLMLFYSRLFVMAMVALPFVLLRSATSLVSRLIRYLLFAVMIFIASESLLDDIQYEYIGVAGGVIILLVTISGSYAILASTLLKYTMGRAAVYFLLLGSIASAEALGHEYVIAVGQSPPTSVIEIDSSKLKATPLFATGHGLIAVIDGEPSISFIGWEQIKQITHTPGTWSSRAARADNTPIVVGKPIYCFFNDRKKECKEK